MSHLGQSRQTFSDATIRRFLLARLSTNQRSAFEAALFSSSQLVQRVRTAEIELTDAYATDRLRADERVAFRQRFLVTNDRLKKLEVSTALQKSFAPDFVSQPGRSSNQVFAWPRLAWRVAFAVIALMLLFASALVIRKEPQIVKRIIPRRFRPVAVGTPTPEAAHHPADSSESPVHREDSPPLPGHEVSPQTIILGARVTAENAPVISLAQNGTSVVRLQLKLETHESAAFSILVTTSGGEVVHNVPETRVESADHIDFDIQGERLKPGEYQVTLTRLTGEPGVAGMYYFRVQ